MPELSLCIPTYQRPALLRRLLEHLLNFTQLDFEIVASDNASNDETPRILEEYSRKFPRFRWFRQQVNVGAQRNFDAVSHAAEGDVIYVAPDDDLPVEAGLAKAMEWFRKDPAVMGVYGKHDHRELATDRPTRPQQNVLKPLVVTKQSNLVDFFKKSWQWELPLCRREIHHRFYFVEGYNQAVSWNFLRFMLDHGNVVLLPDVFQIHHEHAGITNYASPEMMEIMRSDYHYYFERCPGITDEERLLLEGSRMSRIYWVASLSAMARKNYLQVRHYLRMGKPTRPVEFEAQARQFESRWLLPATAQRLASLVEKLCTVTTVTFEDSPLGNHVAALYQAEAPRAGIRVIARERFLTHAAEAGELLVPDDHSTLVERRRGVQSALFMQRALLDLVESCRLTEGPIDLAPYLGAKPRLGPDHRWSPPGAPPPAAPPAPVETSVTDDPRAAFVAAVALQRAGKLDEAAREYERTLAMDPAQGEAWNNLGILEGQRGNAEAGLTALQRAGEIEPGNSVFATNLGNACRRVGKTEQAFEAYRRALNMGPGSQSAMLGLGETFREKGDLEGALHVNHLVLKLHPDSGQAMNNLGLVTLRLGRPEEAEGWFRRAIETGGATVARLENLASCLRTLGRAEEAEEIQRQARTLSGRGA